jgi:hypothetical protein
MTALSSKLRLAQKYSKKDLATILEEPSLAKGREGVYYCKKEPSTLLFVDLIKQGKEERFHFNDYFEDDYFHWDSQTTKHIKSPTIVKLTEGETTALLFVRIHQKVKSVTQPFIYCGRLNYVEFEEGTSKPVHLLFESIDYDEFTNDEDLKEIYSWRPEKSGKSRTTKIRVDNKISVRRKQILTKPNETERTGLVTSRVGQGYYRQQILEKWGNVCAVTGCDLTQILISSHIVPWSESTDEERLDPENGILLSPTLDALFDKHLISFSDDGSILLSKKLEDGVLASLTINKEMRIRVSDGMRKYLERHRRKFWGNATA